MTFRERWLDAVSRKDSVLCAGLDPVVTEMGRGEGWPTARAEKREWALRYVEAVAPWSAALKLNTNYWKAPGDPEAVSEIVNLAHSLGMTVIEDCKLADIGSTNDAGMYHAAQKGFDAVTHSPFAGNIGEARGQAAKWGIGLITMCLMSNPEYRTEKTKLVEIAEEDSLPEDSVVRIGSSSYAYQYLHLAQLASAHGVDGIVIGAPSPRNHIAETEISRVATLLEETVLILVPGVGAQGGQPEVFWKYFQADRVIVNCGRDLMYPKSGEHAENARNLAMRLNRLRHGAPRPQ